MYMYPDLTLHARLPEFAALGDMLRPVSQLTAEELAEAGYRELVEDALPTDASGWAYLPGDHVDVVEGLVIHRTYPNAVPDEAGWAAHLEELAGQVRAERTRRLTASDWTQLADAPLSEAAKAAWSTYRQALRDVPGQAAFPVTVNWPEEPA